MIFGLSLLVQETAIDVATAGILLIVFIATLIRSTFGFGEALVAVPLLAFFIPLEVAAPLAVLVSITIAGNRGAAGLEKDSLAQHWLAGAVDAV